MQKQIWIQIRIQICQKKLDRDSNLHFKIQIQHTNQDKDMIGHLKNITKQHKKKESTSLTIVKALIVIV